MHLKPIEMLLQRAKEEELFQKNIQAYLGHLAQQYWSHFFYDSLNDLDPQTDVKALYHVTSPYWETIFELKDAK